MISLQWLNCYQDAGEFCLVVRATPRNFRNLIFGAVLYKTDGITAGIIESVQLEDDARTGKITTRGHLSVGMLNRRVALATTTISNVETGIYSLVSQNLRGLPLQIGTAQGIPDALDTQVSWGDVLSGVTSLARSSGLGFRARFDPYEATHTFEVYKGVDRTAGAENYTGYFGDDIGNVLKLSTLDDDSDYHNIAVVAGEGSGSERKVVFVGASDAESRRELYVDARDLQSSYSTATDTGEVDESGNPIIHYTDRTYTDAEYTAVLAARGESKLADKSVTSTLSVEVQAGESMRYRVDFDVGDIVTLKALKYGITQNVRVAGVKEIYERTGYRVTATLENA